VAVYRHSPSGCRFEKGRRFGSQSELLARAGCEVVGAKLLLTVFRRQVAKTIQNQVHLAYLRDPEPVLYGRRQCEVNKYS